MPTLPLTPAPAAGWAILCDFDGTIAVEDVIDTLLERHGLPGWEQLEEDWRAGRIGSGECMRGQVRLLDLDREALDAHLDGLSIDPAFPRFVALAERHGLPLQVVSDGLDHAIHRVLERHGLGHLPVAANRLLAGRPPEHWRLESPHAVAGCDSGTCKCERARQAGAGGRRRTLLVGDGASDFCVAGEVDFVFAKQRLIGHCRSHGIPHLAIEGFEDALRALPLLLGGRLPAPAPAVAGLAAVS